MVFFLSSNGHQKKKFIGGTRSHVRTERVFVQYLNNEIQWHTLLPFPLFIHLFSDEKKFHDGQDFLRFFFLSIHKFTHLIFRDLWGWNEGLVMVKTGFLGFHYHKGTGLCIQFTSSTLWIRIWIENNEQVAWRGQ